MDQWKAPDVHRAPLSCSNAKHLLPVVGSLASLLHSGSRDPAFELPGWVLVSRTEEIRPQSLLSLSFTLHDRTTRATGSTMRESFPARAGSRPPPSRCPSSGGRLDRATIRSDSTSVARSWPVIRRKSDSTADSSINYSVRNSSRVQSEGETVKLGSVPTQPDGSSHL